MASLEISSLNQVKVWLNGWEAWLKKAFKKNLWSKLGYLHVKKGINEISDTLDYKSTGGAMLLGVNGVVVKAHGNSDAYSFKNALKVAKAMVNAKVNDKIKEGLLANE